LEYFKGVIHIEGIAVAGAIILGGALGISALLQWLFKEELKGVK
jgi:hypothetical protein